MSQGLGELRLHLCRILDAHALDADGFSMAAKFGLTSSVPVSRKPVDFCSSSIKPERTIVEHDYLHGELELRQAQKIAHQHGESTVAGQRDHLALRESGLSPNGLRHRIRHGAVPERADQTTPAIHREISRAHTVGRPTSQVKMASSLASSLATRAISCGCSGPPDRPLARSSSPLRASA